MRQLRILVGLLGIIGVVLGLAACQTTPPPCPVEVESGVWTGEYVDGAGQTGLRGRVVLRDGGAPLAGAYVNIYSDTLSNLLGPSQFMSTPTDAAGNYRVVVPPGTYYAVARKRISGHPTGPLETGDYYSEHQRIKVRVEPGKFAIVELPVVPMKAPMFFKNNVAANETSTGIRGQLLDREGKPVAGGFAMAYADKEMKRQPDYASALSDDKGQFIIYLPKGGTFFVAARINAWDMPLSGEPYGIFGGVEPAAVTVDAGKFVENVRIEMLPFTGDYRPGKSKRPF
jgi:hypothetical protein